MFLFPTLFRFDAVYHTHFKCTQRRVVDWTAHHDRNELGVDDGTTMVQS